MAHEEIMSLDILSAQTKSWHRLSQISISGQIGSAYLFSGPPGCGKESMAIHFSQLLNCENPTDIPCGRCPSCHRIRQLQHENLKIIFPLPTLKKNINSEEGQQVNSEDVERITDALLKKSEDHFHKIRIPKANRILIQSVRELRKTLYLKGQARGRKVVIIFDAHLLSSGRGEAANALLKILEEPPGNTTLILVTDHADLLFPTIISRCQRIGFPRLEDSFVQEWLRGKMVKESDIPLLTGLSSGNIHQSRYLIAQPVNHLINLINDLITTLISDNPDQWRNFIQTYSRIATQDPAMFSFHFMLLKIWFRSANRFRKGVNDLLHTTSFKPMMEGLINMNRNADFSAITFELEEAILSIPQNLYMPLILTNLLLRIQKYLHS